MLSMSVRDRCGDPNSHLIDNSFLEERSAPDGGDNVIVLWENYEWRTLSEMSTHSWSDMGKCRLLKIPAGLVNVQWWVEMLAECERFESILKGGGQWTQLIDG